MNFFEAQHRARRSSAWLVLLFLLAMSGLIIVTNLLVLGVLAYLRHNQFIFTPQLLWQQFSPDVFIGVSLLVLLLVALGSLYKTLLLARGGPAVAEMLGGRLVPRSSRDPGQRRLLNVVEEMAIAAGMPVPRVYLLDEPGINAFAAGLSPGNAVIGVTRGALESLSRDELQGVIAHEFSHIFNGDMRINLRLMGILHGILLLGLIGYYLLRITRYLRSSRNRKGGNVVVAIVALGAGLVAVGYIGFFFGQWIKALISRQREYLADASAVRYTRNRDGIAGALKKIGGSQAGSSLQAPAAPEYSHAYFAAGVSGLLQSLFATHPPLPARIRRVEPGWDGRFITPQTIRPEQAADTETETETGIGAEAGEDRIKAGLLAGATAAAVLSADAVIGQAGQMTMQQLAMARHVLHLIPMALRHAAEEPFGARAVIYGLLLDRRPDIRSQQENILQHQADPEVARQTQILEQDLARLPAAARLPLMELALPALQDLSRSQYQRFREVSQALIAADRRVVLPEWIVQRFVLQQLDHNFGLRKPAPARHALLGAVKAEAELILSLLAYTEHPTDAAAAAQAFDAGKAAIGAAAFRLQPRAALQLDSLNQALDGLEALKPLLKARVLKACAALLMYDGQATERGMDLLRTLASCLDVPLPLPVGPSAVDTVSA